ncbi:MAG: LysR family transcriptional regulator [Alphaproteobacteria bacterium]|nr:LysR family transcriptional regulator [Alphaproteobacteria bacterium]
MDHWTELRTALMVARTGTIMKAAASLNIHRATVNRHIDYLEEQFEIKLFQRHAKGYELTEAGRLFLDVVGRADEMFEDLTSKLKSQKDHISGNVVVTTLPGISTLVMPAINAFRTENPQVTIRLETSAELARLEVGEAHVAIRAGQKPTNPDYVVQLFCHLPFGLYASDSYIARYGKPTAATLGDHLFVSAQDEQGRYPFTKWFKANVKDRQISLTTDDLIALAEAVKNGLGLGFMSAHDAANISTLSAVIPLSAETTIPIWMVTHIDLHRTIKVQSFTNHLKAHARHFSTE